jgi:Subtilase family
MRTVAWTGTALVVLGTFGPNGFAGDRPGSQSKPEIQTARTPLPERAPTPERSETVQSRGAEQPDDRASKSTIKSREQDRPPAQGGAKSEKSEQQHKAEDNKTPDTVAEWLQQMLKPSKQPITSAEPVAKSQASSPKAPKPHISPNTPQLVFEKPELLAPNLSQKSLARALALGFKPNGTSALPNLGLGFTRLLAPDGLSADQAKELLRQALPEQGLEINQTYRIYRTATGGETGSKPPGPATPMATPCGTDRCFGASAIKWQAQVSSCAKNVKIGVVDTAIEATHLALTSPPVTPKPDDISAAFVGAPRASSWHGTGVLALLAGGANSTVRGLIPDAKYYLADIFTPDTNGVPTSDTATLLAALNWLGKRDVNIINMSLAGPHDELLKKAIEALSRKGIIFIAAVGNEGPTAPPTYPSAYEQVIAVTAINRDLSNYRHAVRGDHVDIAAPGVGIWTAMPDGKGAYHSGTSFAVPFVTAAVAAIYNQLQEKTKAGVLKRLEFVDLGAPGRDPIFGHGLLIAPTSCEPLPNTNHARAPLTAVNARAAGSR